MDRAEYLTVQAQLGAMGALLCDMPLGEFLSAINRAESLGQIVDPTLYKNGAQSLRDWRLLAEGALKFQRAVREVRTSALSRAAAQGGRT